MTALFPSSASALATAPREDVAPSLPAITRPSRLVSVDAYRGLVMLLMMGEVLRLSDVARNTGSAFWSFLAYHQTHVEYLGCSLHDLIQSSFSFLVGVALPFSIASRRARGQSVGLMTLHAAWRALLLIALGVFLRSIDQPRTNFSFTDTLCQIGLGYVWLFLLAFRPARDQWIALAVILVGYWLAFALYPVPAPPIDFVKLGVPRGWLQLHPLTGFAAHWNKYGNASWAFDRWFLNLFPREKPWIAGNFGSTTLSFIPTLGTMILGLLAGGVFRNPRTATAKIRWFLAAGVATGVIGFALGAAGVCPVVKRIWTPSWTLYSGGWCFLLLALFYAATDVVHRRAWAYPLIVVGMNSIAAYCIAHVCVAFITKSLQIHLGEHTFRLFGPAYEPLALGACVLLVEWLILWWMYRRKLFLKI
jgi:heparan-alpha-glucosaminide N-acetyltransferase